MKLEDIKVGSKWTSGSSRVTVELVRYNSVVFSDGYRFHTCTIEMFTRLMTPGWPIKLEVGKWYKIPGKPYFLIMRYTPCNDLGASLSVWFVDESGKGEFPSINLIEEVPAPEGF